MKRTGLLLAVLLIVAPLAGAQWAPAGPTSSAGAGTVESVALTAPAQLNVTGSPVTSSGTIALSWASAAQGTIFAGPCSGSGTPAFRNLCAADIPTTLTGLASVTSTVFVGALTGNADTATTATTANAVAAAALTGLTAETTADNADLLLIYDNSASALRKMTRANFVAGVGAGDVVGPASSTDNAIARFDSTTGKLLQNSLAEITDAGELKLAATLGNGAYFGTDTDTKYAWRSDNNLALYAAGSEVARIGQSDTVFFNSLVQNYIFNAQATTTYANEVVTLSTSGTTTVTSGTLAKAQSRIKAILWRVTTGIGTATDFSVQVTGGTNFVAIGTATAAQTSVTANSTGVLVPANYADQFIASDTTMTITTTGTPSAGAIRLVVVYEKYQPSSA